MAEADEAASDTVPAAPAVGPVSERRPRLAVPLLLAAGWGALFSYSLTYLMDDTPRDGAPRDRGIAAEAAVFDLTGDVPRPLGSPLSRARWREQGPETTAAIDAAARVVPASLSQEVDPAPTTAAPNAVRAERPAPALPESSRPVTARPDGPRQNTPRQDSVRTEAPRNETPRKDKPRTEYAGVWGPTAIACGARSRRRGYLPATITDDGAKAGRTLCRFHNGRRDGPAWVVAADCTDRGHSWTSQVRLLVEGDRLTWTSAKGTSAYVRCGRRDG